METGTPPKEVSMSLKEKVAVWQKERAEGKVSWESLVAAASTFAGDYAIVNHAGDPVVSMMGEPRSGDHLYSVSGPIDMNESGFEEQVKDKECVVVVACMDARAVTETYNQLKAQYPDKVIIFMSMGGGIVQQDEVVQQGNTQEVHRAQALSTMLEYVREKANVVKVIATGHDARCGAVAFYNDGKGVPELLGVEKGSEAEQEDMKKRIAEATSAVIPKEWSEAGIVETALVHIDEHNHTVETHSF